MKKQSLLGDHSAWKVDVLSENWCVKVTEVMCWGRLPPAESCHC